MEAEINGMDSNYILNTSVEDLSLHFESKYSIVSPKISEEGIYADHKEASIDVSKDSSRAIINKDRPFYVTGVEITYFVPFTGDAQMFHSKPSTYTYSPPFATINGSTIEFTYQTADHDVDGIKRSYAYDLAETKKWLGWIENNLRTFNEALKNKAKQMIEARRQKLLKDQGMIVALGVPIRKREDAPKTFSVPVKRKEIPLPSTPSSSKPFIPEPALAMDIYENILSIISNMVHVMERSPQAFRKMGEEDLRQHFLVQLNAQYQGQATGETFNLEGKTDILIRSNDKNVFISECKIWKGEKSLLAAIDQLLGYATWRDTKAAILLFNRAKDFSKVIAQIPEITKKHPNYKRNISFVSESGYRFVFGNKDDMSREIILTILAFNIPK